MILAIYIINKAGGLIYQRDYTENLSKLTSNEYLVLAGTFHGVHALASRISPVSGSSGLEVLEADTFKLHCFQTMTGTKFLVISDPNHANVDAVIRRTYEIYADYALKSGVCESLADKTWLIKSEDPFYSSEMPIRVELFESNLSKFIRSVNTIGNT